MSEESITDLIREELRLRDEIQKIEEDFRKVIDLETASLREKMNEIRSRRTAMAIMSSIIQFRS